MTEKPKVITFVSGKGGAGKTTATISIAKIVADIGFRSLLIDCDLATNGASYFFRPRFKSHSKGVWEILSERTGGKPTVIDISSRFSFVASRVGLGVRNESLDAVKLTEAQLKESLLEPLVSWAAEKGFAYVFVDCQAGYTVATKAAVEVADSLVVVTEADSISSDAADNLLIQLGGSLPPDRKFLVNKVDVRDAATYRSMRAVFQTLNRLPPLPFDFSVRNAFGARRIPVEADQPSPLLFALLQTLIALLPERFDAIESFKRTHVDALFERYDKEMGVLVAKRENLLERMKELNARADRERARLVQLMTLGGAAIAGVFGAKSLLDASGSPLSDLFGKVSTSAVAAVVAMLLTLGSKFVFAVKSPPAEEEEKRLSLDLGSIERDLDHYRSLLLVQSKEVLLDDAVAGGHPLIPGEPAA